MSDSTGFNTHLLALLLGGRTSTEVMADFERRQDDAARHRAMGHVLITDQQRAPSGMVSGLVSPVWVTPAERARRQLQDG